QDVSKCLSALDELSTVPVSSRNIQNHSELIDTLRKGGQELTRGNRRRFYPCCVAILKPGFLSAVGEFYPVALQLFIPAERFHRPVRFFM
ncbi:hypothetical protein cypCar_00034722, partial [Cyprinus carpio]